MADQYRASENPCPLELDPLLVAEIDEIAMQCYEVVCADGSELSVWPRATAPTGVPCDAISFDEHMRPFVAAGSLVSKELVRA